MPDAQTQFAEAVAFHQAGDLAAAEPAYRQVLESVPHHLDALYLLGTLQLQRGEFAAAVEILTQVSAAQPEVAAAHNNLGIAYKAQGQFDAGDPLFPNCAISRDAQLCGGLFQSRPNIMRSSNNGREAEDMFRQTDRRWPRRHRARVRLGFVLTQQDKWDQAAQVYERSCNSSPGMRKSTTICLSSTSDKDDCRRRVAAAERAWHCGPIMRRGTTIWEMRCDRCINWKRPARRLNVRSRIKPDFSLATFNLATTRMLAGDLAGRVGRI